MTERYRNHPTALLDTAVPLLATLAFIFFVSSRGQIEMLVIYSIIFVVVMAYSVVVWMRTWVLFEDTELVVLRDAKIVKTTKRIQYTRLASVAVTRSIINRICGTTRLTFNVNSSINANVPEATLTVRADLAERMRCELNQKIFSKMSEKAEEPEMESLVKVSNREIVIHSLVSQSTPRLIFAILMLVYSILSILYDSAGGLIIPLILLIANEVIPLVKEILTYCNYRLYRVGDTITVESGLITTVRRSFKVGKVNSIRLRQPLLARLMGKSVLEAEVVGLTIANDDNRSPLLCPLKNDAEVRELMAAIMPEIVFEPESVSQTRGAFMAMGLTNLICSCAAVAMAIVFAIAVRPMVTDADGLVYAIMSVTEIFVVVGIPLLLIGHVVMAQRNRRFAMGSESFLLVYGSYDTSSEYILYDKVQYSSVSAGPIQRRFGTSVLHVNMMSSQGFKEVSSGLFPPAELELVPSEIMGRIHDGRYDHRRYE